MITLRHFTKTAPTTKHLPTLVGYLRKYQATTLRRAASCIAHPRSLARPTPTWRPPTLHLPNIHHPSRGSTQLTIIRHRVGPHTKAQLRAWDPTTTLLHSPTFLVTFRASHRDGTRPHRATVEAWVRAILPEIEDSTIHELSNTATPTFCVILDGRFHPIPAPKEVFTEPIAA